MTILKRTSPHMILLIYVAVVMFPFVFVLFSSLKESNIEIAERPFAFPTSFYVQNYIDAWVKAKINVYFLIVYIWQRRQRLPVFCYQRLQRMH